ncbi:hypothetical protein AOR13_2558 [Alteromonas stellipolaris LMG 21856]|nr:hypothetical protein AOR13_2558 [Alteromonas stellipolaris LMG 21856]
MVFKSGPIPLTTLLVLVYLHYKYSLKITLQNQLIGYPLLASHAAERDPHFE